MDNGKIIITDKYGEKIECDILFTFDSETNEKSYIVYTDNTLDEHGFIKVYANIYDPYNDSGLLETIEDEEDWSIIEQIFDSIKEKED